MDNKSQKQYRLPYYDYSQNGYYFITICTMNHEMFFGNLTNGEITLSKIGEIAKELWINIPEHFNIIKLDEFIIMPNHIHGIIIIDQENVGTPHVVFLPKVNQFS